MEDGQSIKAKRWLGLEMQSVLSGSLDGLQRQAGF